MLQVGTSWTTLPTTLPPSIGTATSCSSVVYKQYQLVIIAAGDATKQARESGTVLSLQKRDGSWKHRSSLPSLTHNHTGYGNNYFALGGSGSNDILSAASSVVLANNNRFLYAIVRNDNTTQKNNYAMPKQKNIHGYIPQEELYVADLHDYLSNKGLLSKALGFVGSLTCALGLSENNASNSNGLFWKAVLEMEDCGSSLAASSPSSISATTTSSINNCICAVGGYQTLSPKFYQVFSAKESVSRAARILLLPNNSSSSSSSSSSDNNSDSITVHNNNNNNNNTQPPTAMATQAGNWTRLPDMNFRRKNLCTLIVGNYLYALGGQDESGTALASVERLDLSLCSINTTTGDDAVAWEPVASMQTPRYGFSATATSSSTEGQDIYIVVAGGCNSWTNNVRLDSAECLVHSTDDKFRGGDAVWKALPRMQTPRMGASLSIVNSKLVLAGGSKTPAPFWGTGALDTIETLDLVVPLVETGQSSVVPAITSTSAAQLPLPTATAEVIFDEVYGDGGSDAFVSIQHMGKSHAPPTATAHACLPQHQSSSVASLISSEQLMQPSAPTLDEVYHAESTSALPMLPLPPPMVLPQNENDDEQSVTESIVSSPLPPPLLPPRQAAAAAASIHQQDECLSDDDLSCAICLERKKQVAFLCGHQACIQCAPLVNDCHICRKPITARIQLYGD